MSSKKSEDEYLAAEAQSPTISAFVTQIVQVLIVDANLHMYQRPDLRLERGNEPYQ